MSIPCHSRHSVFAKSVQVASEAESAAVDHGCFFIDDQMALVPARYARAYFDSGAEWHHNSTSNNICVEPEMNRSSCPLLMATLAANVTSERIITARLQRHCVPIVMHAFNASLGVKNVSRGVAAGGPGEARTVTPQQVMSNRACGAHFPVR